MSVVEKIIEVLSQDYQIRLFQQVNVDTERFIGKEKISETFISLLFLNLFPRDECTAFAKHF